jgi:MFS family permease
VWLLIAAMTLCFLPIGAYSATLPRWLETDIGVGPATIGALIATMSIVAVAARPLGGRLSDVSGRRATAAIGGVICALGAGLLLVPAAPAVVWPARAAVGIGEALVTTACMAWVVDMVPVERRGRALSWFGISFWLGISLGPQVGAVARELGGFDLVWATAVACSLAAVALFRVTPDSPVRAVRGEIPFALPRAILVPGIALGLCVFGEGVFVTFGVPHLVRAGVHEGAAFGGAASVYSVLGFAALLVRPLMAPLPDRYGGRNCALVGCALLVAGLATIALASSFAVAAVGAASMGVALATLNPALAMLVAAAVEPERRGVAMGGFMSFLDIGLAAGAIAAGFVVAATSTTTAFGMAALAAALSAVLLAARAPTHAQERAAAAALV